MTVDNLKKKYVDIQNESNELYFQMKPLLKRLKSLKKRSVKLSNEIDNDIQLYVKDGNGEYHENGWNWWIYHRLSDFGLIDGSIEEIDAVLYNIKHTKFDRKH